MKVVKKSEVNVNIWKISPKYYSGFLEQNDYSTECYISVYEDRMQGWFIQPAKCLANINHSDFAILSILFSYFETYTQYKLGQSSKGNEKCFFVIGFRDVFNNYIEDKEELATIADNFYSAFRCGIAHSSLPKGLITLKQTKHLFEYDNEEDIVYVDGKVTYPITGYAFLYAIEKFNEKYISSLRDISNKDSIQKFRTMFDEFLRIH